MFSLPLKVTPGSRLSQHLSIVQHLVALAVVTAVRSLPSYEVGHVVAIFDVTKR